MNLLAKIGVNFKELDVDALKSITFVALTSKKIKQLFY